MVSIFVGGLRPLPPENRPTGMFKTLAQGPVWLGREGLAGDRQADRRVHGGPQMALHQYPQAHYARLAQAFPHAAKLLTPGSIGENLSVPDWDEGTVCVGDVFRLGEARIQVSQPRSPCWKIEHRYDAAGMVRFIDEAGLTGWYFRVLVEGEVACGCPFELIERPHPQHSLAQLWQLWKMHRPDADALNEFSQFAALSPEWAQKLKKRAIWLKAHQ